MQKRILPLTVLAVLALAVGLWLSLAPGRGAAERAPVPNQTVDEIYAQMALDSPGFAGLYLDPDQETLHVLVKYPTPEKVATVERAVRSYLEGNQAPRSVKVYIVPAQYDFAQLKDWYDRMSGGVWNVHGVTLTDIDEVK